MTRSTGHALSAMGSLDLDGSMLKPWTALDGSYLELLRTGTADGGEDRLPFDDLEALLDVELCDDVELGDYQPLGAWGTAGVRGAGGVITVGTHPPQGPAPAHANPELRTACCSPQ